MKANYCIFDICPLHADPIDKILPGLPASYLCLTLATASYDTGWGTTFHLVFNSGLRFCHLWSSNGFYLVLFIIFNLLGKQPMLLSLVILRGIIA